ncbi:FtsK/SpoIIIE N-terminal domain-containing protein [Bacillus licheniformis]
MSLLWIFYHKNYQKIKLDDQNSRTLTIGPDLKHSVTIKHFSFEKGPVTLEKQKDSDALNVQLGGETVSSLKLGGKASVQSGAEQLTLFLAEEADSVPAYYLGERQEIVISSLDQEADVYFNETDSFFGEKGTFSFIRLDGQWNVLPNDAKIYLNGEEVSAPVSVQNGDEIAFGLNILRIVEDDLLEIEGFGKFDTSLENILKPSSETKNKYPQYRRPPRMIYDLPDEKVSFSFPAQESDGDNRGLWLMILPPLVMLIVMGIVALIQPRGIFIIVSLAMFMMTLITSTVQYFRDKNQRKKREEKRERVYTLYLENKKKELHELAERQKFVLDFHFPTFERMKYLTKEISGRIWEKSIESADFLQIRLGTGNVASSYQINLNGGDLANRDTDHLLEQTQKMEEVYRELKNAPITVNLAEGPMGVVGKLSVVKNEIHQLVGQLAFFHSYHDLRFVFIFDEAEYQEWEWMKWLPHFQMPHIYAKGFIYNEQTRDQLLSSIYEILRERDLDENKKKTLFKPHFVFIITNQQLIAEHVILEYLEGKQKHLGVSTIVAAETKESLSENIHTLVRYITEQEGDILIKQKKAVQIPFQLDHHNREDNEQFSRTLRTLDHQTGMTNSIPDTVSFLELFQSAWSGAPYMEDGYGTEDEVAIVTDTGLIPLSDVDADRAAKKEAVTEISAVVEQIERIQAEMGIEKLPSPWLPPLEERIPKTRYPSEEADAFNFAYIDEPEKQSQEPISYRMMEDGNIGIVGSSGYGKSLTATTFMMSFAEQYTPEELHYYIFDFGNGTLLPLARLPHTADYFLMDQTRKIEKFMVRIKAEIEHRKNLFRAKEISHIKMYNALNEEKLPFIFITVDNFDIIKDEMHELESEFIQFSRDGQSLGIYLILTATRVNAIRQSLLNNLKTRVVHYLMDQSEAYSIIGRPEFSLEPIPGRVIINKENQYFAQMFMPVEADNDIELFEGIKADIQAIAERSEGMRKPAPVPMLPLELSVTQFVRDYPLQPERGLIPMGLDEETVEPVYFNLEKNKHCLIMGQTQRGKTNVIKIMLEHLLDHDTKKIAVFDSIDRGLSQYATEDQISYLETKDDILLWLAETEEICRTREAMYLEAVKQGEIANLDFSPMVFIVDGISRFQQTIDASIQDKMAMFMKSYAHLGFHFIPAGNHSEFTKGYDSLTSEVKQVRHAMLLMKKSEQNLIQLPYERQEPEILPGFGYIVENGKERKIQIPLCAVERKKAK